MPGNEDDTRPVKTGAEKTEVAYTYTEVDEERAKRAYEAYTKRMAELGFGPPPQFTGVSTWDEQQPWVRECWRVAVRAVAKSQ